MSRKILVGSSVFFNEIKGLPPLTKDSVGKKGEWAIDSSYLYICVDTNTWERIAYDDTWGNE